MARGGKRIGAGRPAVDSVRISVSLSREDAAKLRALGGATWVKARLDEESEIVESGLNPRNPNEYVINSKKLGRVLTFMREYRTTVGDEVIEHKIYVDKNGKPGVLGVLLMKKGAAMEATEADFVKVCKQWYRAECKRFDELNGVE